MEVCLDDLLDEALAHDQRLADRLAASSIDRRQALSRLEARRDSVMGAAAVREQEALAQLDRVSRVDAELSYARTPGGFVRLMLEGPLRNADYLAQGVRDARQIGIVLLGLMAVAWLSIVLLPLWIGFLVIAGALLLVLNAPTDLFGLSRTLRHDLSRHLIDAEKRVREFRRTVVEAGVKEELRALINERTTNRFSTEWTVTGFQGLAEIENPDFAVDTEARERLDDLVGSMPGGSIAISGPRGAGKTTLMRRWCPATAPVTDERIALMAPAPVDYGAREYVLHLFAEACRVVLGDDRVAALRAPAAASAWSPSRTGLTTAAVVMSLLAWVAVGLLYAGVDLAAQDLLVAVPVLIGALVATMTLPARITRVHLRRTTLLNGYLLLPPPRSGDDFERQWELLQERAVEHLQAIWFQQSYSTGWSGTLKPPIGLELGVEGSHELARNQMSLPDIVREFRTFIQSVPEPMQVIVGIDELDKMGSSEVAQSFLNEIKVIFGIERCFYLLSISEDAIGSFERRGLPLRDVFDSSFDDAVHVPPLTVTQSAELLHRRVVDMPLPFVMLCHCFAGGLPRDVIRVARALVMSADGGDDTPAVLRLGDATETLVDADVERKVRVALSEAAKLPPGADARRVVAWLSHVRSRPVTRFTLADVASASGSDVVAGLDDPEGAPARLARELISYCYFAATVLETFDDPGASRDLETIFMPDAGKRRWIDRLAEARQAFAVDPVIAREACEDFRARRTLV